MATDYNKNAVRLIEPWVNKKIEEAVASALASGGAIETAISAKVDAAVAAHEAKEESATFANSHVVDPTPPAPPTLSGVRRDGHAEDEWKVATDAKVIVSGANLTGATSVKFTYMDPEGEGRIDTPQDFDVVSDGEIVIDQASAVFDNLWEPKIEVTTPNGTVEHSIEKVVD